MELNGVVERCTRRHSALWQLADEGPIAKVVLPTKPKPTRQQAGSTRPHKLDRCVRFQTAQSPKSDNMSHRSWLASSVAAPPSRLAVSQLQNSPLSIEGASQSAARWNSPGVASDQGEGAPARFTEAKQRDVPSQRHTTETAEATTPQVWQDHLQ